MSPRRRELKRSRLFRSRLKRGLGGVWHIGNFYSTGIKVEPNEITARHLEDMRDYMLEISGLGAR